MALLCCLLTLACWESLHGSETALYVTTEFDDALRLTQLRVWCSLESGHHLGPKDMPEQESRELQSGETLRILLPEAPDGTRVRVGIEGLSHRVPVARGEATLPLRSGHEVDIALQLLALCGSEPACQGLDVDRCESGQCRCGEGERCQPGQRCVGGRCLCTPDSCAGCCLGEVCHPGTEKPRCGTGGETCQKCTTSCAPSGSCR